MVIFEELPDEIFFCICQYLNLTEIGILSFLSKKIRDKIIKYYILSKVSGKKCVPEIYCEKSNSLNFKRPCNNQEVILKYQIFKNLGFFLKRVTCVFPTKKRLDILFKFFDQIQIYKKVQYVKLESEKELRFKLKCLGILINAFVSGWDCNETWKLFKLTEKYFGVDYIVHNFCLKQCGFDVYQEYYIRYFYRSVFFDFINYHEERAFWLSKFLNCQKKFNPNITHTNSKLLLLLFGPLISEEDNISKIGWNNLSINLFVEQGLALLGYSIHILFNHSNDFIFCNKNILYLIQDIIRFNNPWLFENVCTLLYYCGNDIIKMLITYLSEEQLYDDLIKMIMYLCIINSKLEKQNDFLKNLISLLKFNLNKELYLIVLDSLPKFFFELIKNLFETNFIDENRDYLEEIEVVKGLVDLFQFSIKENLI